MRRIGLTPTPARVSGTKKQRRATRAPSEVFS
jgi:hypothetical protein